jgi:hypothetical protein
MSTSSKIAIGLLALALILALLYALFGGPQGGPIIVIQPEPDGGLTDTTPDYTGWYWCNSKPNCALKKCVKDDTYVGIPGPLSARCGAKSIAVTLNQTVTGTYPAAWLKGPFEVVAIDIPLDSSTAPLTIARPTANDILMPHGVPTWNFGTKILPFQSKPVYDWSSALYGHFKKVSITETPTSKPVDVDVLDLQSIWIVYNDIPPFWSACP